MSEKKIDVLTSAYGIASRSAANRQPDTAARWYVLWTHSNCERLVYEQLRGQGFELLLPLISQWVRRRGLRYLTKVPMFPGYLFLHHAIDKFSYLQVCKTRGLVRILGEQWDRLAAVPEREIDAIRKLVGTDLPALPHPYLREGQRVRVIQGPLANAEGILIKSEPEKGTLVLSVDLLRRSVGVQIDCTLVRPV
ncbi:MAG TPA: transcription termination/antitermination NusG family protein [Gammaproteobacteria bacterium]|nr:transcription termination/antitermination NusG family protein [Gammaproteobacteria bacterium]